MKKKKAGPGSGFFAIVSRGEAVLPVVEQKREGVDVWNRKVCYNLGILLKGWS